MILNSIVNVHSTYCTIRIMSLDISYIYRSEGATLLVEYCEDIADQLI